MTEQQPKRMRIGEGKISGSVAIFLSSLTFIGLLCFRFPEWLTTPEFRELYTGEMMEQLMFGVIIASIIFALISFILSKSKKYAVISFILIVLTIALGGFAVEGRAVEKVNWSIGLDWLILDLFIMALLFVPIELVFPKRKEQPRFHLEWRTDLVYFAISHLFIQLFGVITKKPAEAFFGWIELGPIREWIVNLPFLAEIFLALLVTDVFQYWAHRIFHSHHYLWRFHSVHHSTKSMDWLAGSRTHFVDIFFVRAMSYVPLYILGFSTFTFNFYIVFIAIHAVLIHANTNINFGFFKIPYHNSTISSLAPLRRPQILR